MRNKNILLVAFNLLVLAGLLWKLTDNLSIIDKVDLVATEYADSLIKAVLLKQAGIDVNLIIGFTAGLLIINALVYRQWIKSKRWILHPILIFILSIGLSLAYYLNLTKNIGKKIKVLNNEWVGIKSSRSIEKYQDFLICHPKTKHLSEITDSLRIFWKEYSMQNGHHDCNGNCLTLLINKHGQILFKNKLHDVKDLKEIVKYSILNPDNLPDLPEKELVTIKGVGDFVVSRGVIDIITDKELDHNKYSEIIAILKESFMDMRNDLSMALYGKNLQTLNQEQRSNIEIIVPVRIRFERYIPGPPELPIPFPGD